MIRYRSIYNLLSLLLIAIAMMNTYVQAEGLPFRVESHNPAHANTIVMPKDTSEDTAESLNNLTNIIERIPQPIWTEAANN